MLSFVTRCLVKWQLFYYLIYAQENKEYFGKGESSTLGFHFSQAITEEFRDRQSDSSIYMIEFYDTKFGHADIIRGSVVRRVVNYYF